MKLYHVHLVSLIPRPCRRGDDEEYLYVGRLIRSSHRVRENALLGAAPPPPFHVQVALRAGEAVLKLRRHGEVEWTEHRYTEEDWHLTDVAALEGVLFGVTADGEHVAEVRLGVGAEVEVVLVESESYDDECVDGREWEVGQLATRHHIFDLQTDKITDVAMLKTRAGRIHTLGIL